LPLIEQIFHSRPLELLGCQSWAFAGDVLAVPITAAKDLVRSGVAEFADESTPAPQGGPSPHIGKTE